MICGLGTRWNGNNGRLPMVTNPEDVVWPIGEAALLLSGALYAQNGVSRQPQLAFENI